MKKERKMIPLDKIHPNEWNPNEQSDETFNKLVENIRETEKEGDVFDHPLLVVPCECDLLEGIHYKLIGGEHRWKAVRVLGWDEIECVIYHGWDEKVEKLTVVQRNLLTGDLNDAKFTELVNSLRDQEDMPLDQISDVMGFDSQQDFAKHYIDDKEEADKNWLDEMLNDSKQEVDAVDSLSDILNTIFSEYGETVPQNFLFFSYKGKTHLLVMMNKKLFKLTEDMVEQLKTTESNINDYLYEALKKMQSNAQE